MTPHQWQEFARRFPAADAWITARELENELARLQAEAHRLRSSAHTNAAWNDTDRNRLTWIDARLAEIAPYAAAIAGKLERVQIGDRITYHPTRGEDRRTGIIERIAVSDITGNAVYYVRPTDFMSDGTLTPVPLESAISIDPTTPAPAAAAELAAGAQPSNGHGYQLPDQCPECARSFGPHYRGPCEH